jgi:hypothetical protein
VIQELVEAGDDNQERVTFGVFADRQITFESLPTDVAYQHRIAGQNARIEVYGAGVEVRPWNVKPGQWVFLPDFLAGTAQPTDKRLDPRYLFIESVKFSAPYDLSLNGGKVNTIRQLLAQQGMR